MCSTNASTAFARDGRDPNDNAPASRNATKRFTVW
jgi:hypothetical protein